MADIDGKPTITPSTNVPVAARSPADVVNTLLDNYAVGVVQQPRTHRSPGDTISDVRAALLAGTPLAAPAPVGSPGDVISPLNAKLGASGGKLPLVASGANGTAAVGDTTSFTPTIGGGTAPYTVTATGLPPGRAIQMPSTGLTTGAYTTAGSSSATYTVTDSGSPQQTASFTRSVVVSAAQATNVLTLRDGTPLTLRDGSFLLLRAA